MVALQVVADLHEEWVWAGVLQVDQTEVDLSPGEWVAHEEEVESLFPVVVLGEKEEHSEVVAEVTLCPEAEVALSPGEEVVSSPVGVVEVGLRAGEGEEDLKEGDEEVPLKEEDEGAVLKVEDVGEDLKGEGEVDLTGVVVEAPLLHQMKDLVVPHQNAWVDPL